MEVISHQPNYESGEIQNGALSTCEPGKLALLHPLSGSSLLRGPAQRTGRGPGRRAQLRRLGGERAEPTLLGSPSGTHLGSIARRQVLSGESDPCWGPVLTQNSLNSPSHQSCRKLRKYGRLKRHSAPLASPASDMPRTRGSPHRGLTQSPAPPPPWDRPAQNSHSSLHGAGLSHTEALPPRPPGDRPALGRRPTRDSSLAGRQGAARSPACPVSTTGSCSTSLAPQASESEDISLDVTGLSQTLDRVSLETVGASLGALTVGGVSLTPSRRKAPSLSSLEFLPLGKLPYSPA